jgi:hypothetical protein
MVEVILEEKSEKKKKKKKKGRKELSVIEAKVRKLLYKRAIVKTCSRLCSF